MQQFARRTVRATLVAVLGLAAFAGSPKAAASLNGYRVKATAANLRALAAQGFDLTEGRDLKRGTVDVVGTASQIGAAKVAARKLTSKAAQPARDPSRSPQSDATAGASDSAFDVWTKYDAVASDGKEQYTEEYARVLTDYPTLVRKRVVGTTYGGRGIVALQVTKGATGADIAGRPAAPY